jgi:hypothetical protein
MERADPRTAMIKFLVRALIVVAAGVALFTSVDLATAAGLPWWNYMFMWGILVMTGSIVGGLLALRASP